MSANGYHCEVVGSLLRHDDLKQAMERDERGEIDQDELNDLQEKEGKQNIALQEEAGIEVLTDGEVRRRFWFDPLTASLSGYNPEVPAPVMFHGSADKPLRSAAEAAGGHREAGHPQEPSAAGVRVRRPPTAIFRRRRRWRG